MITSLAFHPIFMELDFHSGQEHSYAHPDVENGVEAIFFEIRLVRTQGEEDISVMPLREEPPTGWHVTVQSASTRSPGRAFHQNRLHIGGDVCPATIPWVQPAPAVCAQDYAQGRHYRHSEIHPDNSAKLGPDQYSKDRRQWMYPQLLPHDSGHSDVILN